MIACVWVHVGCLPQIHKQFCQQQDRMVNTKVCKVNTCTLSVCTTHGNASRACVRHHCMVVCVCLYLYDCMCMIDVWLYDKVRMMSWGRPEDHIQLVTACHPTCLRLYQFMLVACPRSISNSVTCRNGMEWTHQHLSGHPEHFPGPWFIYLRAAPLHGCMCMIVPVWLYVYDCMTMCVWCFHDRHKTIYN